MTSIRRPYAVVAVVLAAGLIASGCSKTAEAPSAEAPSAATSTGAVTKAPAAAKDLALLLPTPAGAGTTKGPDSVADNGIHMYYEVNGVPNDVMGAYKSALEGKGWTVTTLTSSGGGGGGGATYTGTHGDAYAVIDGGGYQTNTYIDVCAWPAKPAEPNCKRGGGR